jgi:hypothetical protein
MLESFNENEIPADMSLFEVSAKFANGFGRQEVTFSGQVGQVVRETAIRATERFPQASITRRKSYGASNVLGIEVKKNGLEYLLTLRESKAILCPPGNISGESFRIFETVLMRRIPLAMNAVTSDPNYVLPFKFSGPWQKSYCWGSLISSLLKSKTEVLDELVRRNFDNYQEQIRETKNFLLEEVSKKD